MALGLSTFSQTPWKMTQTLVQTRDSSWGIVFGLGIPSSPVIWDSFQWIFAWIPLSKGQGPSMKGWPCLSSLVSPFPPTELASLSFMFSHPSPSTWTRTCGSDAAAFWLDLLFFFMLNTIIRSHNGMSSALIVIIRLFYTLTALDMKRNCWIPGYVFHYLTPFSFPTCPCGIWHTLSS